MNEIIKTIILVGFGLLELLAVSFGVVNYPKTKKLDLVHKKEYALQLMPEAIKVAESTKETGALKKDFVISSVVCATEQKFGLFNEKDKLHFIDYCNQALEHTLETPQKKEVKNG